jgi:hypothetical protein
MSRRLYPRRSEELALPGERLCTLIIEDGRTDTATALRFALGDFGLRRLGFAAAVAVGLSRGRLGDSSAAPSMCARIAFVRG